MNPNSPIEPSRFDQKFLVEQLLHEYQRRSDVLHKAIDNSYVMLGVMFTVLGGLTILNAKDQHPIFRGIVPFLILCLLYLDAQLRTTFLTNAKHVAFLEQRINNLVEYPLLLWESKLTPGNLFYYKFNKYFILRMLSLFSFLCVLGMAYIFSFEKFFEEIQNIKQFEIFSTVFNANVILWIYCLTLLIATIPTLFLWFFSYTFQSKIYESFLENVAKEELPMEFNKKENESDPSTNINKP